MLKVLEHSSSRYGPRTYQNASKAHVTIAFAVDFQTAGERLTHKAAGDKYLAVDLRTDVLDAARAVYRALKARDAHVLNIAGNGIYTLSRHGWDQHRVNEYVHAVLLKVYEHWPFQLLVSGGQTGVDLAGGVAGLCLGVDVEMTYPKGFKQRHEDKIDRDHTQVEILEQLDAWVSKIKLPSFQT
jgi:nitroreductase